MQNSRIAFLRALRELNLEVAPPETPRVKQKSQLRELWEELRIDILAAQKQYAPQKKPWGCRFDAR